MSVVWSDNFENYAVGSNTITTPWVNTGPFGPSFPDSLISNTIAGGGSTQSLGLGANGGSALGAGECNRAFLANLNELTVDFWVYMPSGSTVPDPPQENAPGALLQNTTGNLGAIVFRMGGAGNCLIGQDGNPNWFSFNISLNTWHHIVWTTTMALSAGASSVTVDGGMPMTFSGNTATEGGDTTVQQISLVGQFVVGSPVATIFFTSLTIDSGQVAPTNDLIEQAAGPVSLGRWRTSLGINWYGMALVGDAYSGVLGLSDFDVFTEYGNIIRFLITTPPIHDDRKRIFMPRFEIEVEAGDGIDGDPTTVPQMLLEWSKDGGVTWSTLKPPQSMGLIGQYIKRLRWLNLGNSRTWVFRLTCTDPLRRYLIGAYTTDYKSLG